MFTPLDPSNSYGLSPIAGSAIRNQGLSNSGGYDGFASSYGFGKPAAMGPLSSVSAPGGQSGLFGSMGGMQGLQLGLGALQTLGGLWNSFNQSKLANKSLKFQTQAFNTNLKNQTQTYNTALEDRIRARYATEGRGEGQAEEYIEKHRL